MESQLVEKYRECGWSIYHVSSINDFIAHRSRGLATQTHFIQLIKGPDDPRLASEAQNAFIQNAFSNNAEPIHATSAGSKKIKLVNINEGTVLKMRKLKP
mgnify:CR=1 FL=1